MLFLNTLLDIIFPAHCLICGKSGGELCLACLKEAREAERESAPWIYRLFDYRDPSIKKSLWLLKYKGKRRLAKIFAEILYEKILEELADLSTLENFTEPILIPIPLSRERRNERGFNQAELICDELVRLSHLTPNPSPCQGEGRRGEVFILEKNILIKPRETKHQAHIENRSERLRNIVGSFAINKENKIEGKNIILIDYITTTGATLSEAKKVLKKAGARSVIAFTVAH